MDSTVKVKNREQAIVKYIILHSLKLSVHQAEFCDRLLCNSKMISDSVQNFCESGVNRKSLGLLVREVGSRPLASQWDLSILMAFLIDALKRYPDLSEENILSLLKQYEKLMEAIFAASLQNSYDLRPILDGKSVAKILKMKPGPQIGVILQHLLEWQLGKIDPTEEEAIQYITLHFAK